MAKIQLIDSDGDELFNGSLTDNNDLVSSFKNIDIDIDIPFSCKKGCCMSCGAKVLKGIEYIDMEKYGEKHIEVEKDTILLCIAGFKKDTPSDAKIIIKTLM